MTEVIFVLIAVSIVGLLLWGAWLAVRAICRALGMAELHQRYVATAFCAAPFVIWFVANLDTLDALERTCRDELVRTDRMAGTSYLTVQKHYDFWSKKMSGGGMFAPWVSEPYQTPKVTLAVEFMREGRQHSALIDCIFSKLPNTGDPPELAFQEIRFALEDVRTDGASGAYTWEPWFPESSVPGTKP